MGCDEVFVCVEMLFMQSSVKKSKGPKIDLWESTCLFNSTMRKNAEHYKIIFKLSNLYIFRT
jgi:hypothetical protein